MNTKLTEEEKRVILHKGTERPFSGIYNDFKKAGTYHCKQCGAALYKSDAKFDSGCGWPSFDDEIPGAVKRLPDADGRRTEILCAKCGGHLGHVFEGERLTSKNTRHCVNSVSLTFVPAAEEKTDDTAVESEARYETGIFAAGCFWGVQQRLKQLPGVVSTWAGYTGGTLPDPTYEQVCRKNTGHAEAVKVVFDPRKISYEEIARKFFEIHDPTQVNRQGVDVGEQYRSEIFYTTPRQKATAEKLVSELRGKGIDAATRITPASEFYKAEEYHQDYNEKHGRTACPL